MNDLIIDGNSLFARAWFAVKEEPEAALKVAVKLVLNLLDRRERLLGAVVSRTLFGWDGKSKTEKNREPKPQIYIDTRYRFQEAILTLFNTVNAYHPEFEADDVVATAVFDSKADQVFVVSGDKDLMQLQGGNVSYFDLNTKGLVSPRVICNKFHVKHPMQLPLAMAITGDSGDGIGGIPKWGPKKVQKVFEWVTDKMSFDEALFAVRKQIPAELMDYFMEALDKTLLHTDLEGIPEASPLEFCDFGDIISLGMDGVAKSYEIVSSQYTDRKSAIASMIRGSRSGSPRPQPD